jgi:histidyl-tRNA synthetase
MVLEERGAPFEARLGTVYVAAMEGTRAVVAGLVRALRMVYTVDCDLEARGLNAQMKAADKSGARALVLLGEEEWERGDVVVKDLKAGTQEVVALERISETLDRLLGEPEETQIP